MNDEVGEPSAPQSNLSKKKTYDHSSRDKTEAGLLYRSRTDCKVEATSCGSGQIPGFHGMHNLMRIVGWRCDDSESYVYDTDLMIRKKRQVEFRTPCCDG